MLTQDQFRSACSSELGKPYIWGGSGEVGFDCSGLTQWALALLALDPPGDQTAEGLYRFFLKRADPVALDQCALGDLIFFGDATAVTHVALGWGEGKMFEAGGGDRTCTTPAIAKAKGAEVRIAAITRRRDRVAILRPRALAWAAATAALEAVVGFGAFDKEPVTTWLADGRHMQLVEPITYTQQDGAAWPVPALAIVDGASIPQPFWSIIGGPFEGQYRDASVVHDYYCDVQTRAWQTTHRMFYEGMRCSGVPIVKAKIMYYAVYRFGPRWTLAATTEAVTPPGGVLEAAVAAGPTPGPLRADSYDAGSANADMQAIAATDPDLAEIEAMADARIATGAAAGE
jgi:hypothetical protein